MIIRKLNLPTISCVVQQLIFPDTGKNSFRVLLAMLILILLGIASEVDQAGSQRLTVIRSVSL
jgi:hypothetical protein